MGPVSELRRLQSELGEDAVILLACSGGLDSMVLLHAAAAVWRLGALVVGNRYTSTNFMRNKNDI